MMGTVGFDFDLTEGGPSKETKRVIATFKKGEKLTIRRVSADDDYPDMYEIEEHPEAGTVSFRIILLFVRHLT